MKGASVGGRSTNGSCRAASCRGCGPSRRPHSHAHLGGAQLPRGSSAGILFSARTGRGAEGAQALERRRLAHCAASGVKLPHSPPSPSLRGEPEPLVDLGDLFAEESGLKVRAARNSEELKAVAALRVSIFQQQRNAERALKERSANLAGAAGAGARGSAAAGRASTSTEAIARPAARPPSDKAARPRGDVRVLIQTPDEQERDHKAWIRRQSGIEAARIYGLGERCLCLMAVHVPKKRAEAKRASSPSWWHAPPVPRLPLWFSDGDSEEEGAVIVGTLNIHFDQPFLDHKQREQYQRGTRGLLRRIQAGPTAGAPAGRGGVLSTLPGIFHLPSVEDKALGRCDEAYIFNLCVSSAYRRKGVATRLLREAHAVAQGKGAKECYLHVDYDNAAAQALYARNGYAYEHDEAGKWTYIAGTRKRQLMKLFL